MVQMDFLAANHVCIVGFCGQVHRAVIFTIAQLCCIYIKLGLLEMILAESIKRSINKSLFESDHTVPYKKHRGIVRGGRKGSGNTSLMIQLFNTNNRKNRQENTETDRILTYNILCDPLAAIFNSCLREGCVPPDSSVEIIPGVCGSRSHYSGYSQISETKETKMAG